MFQFYCLGWLTGTFIESLNVKKALKEMRKVIVDWVAGWQLARPLKKSLMDQLKASLCWNKQYYDHTLNFCDIVLLLRKVCI